MKIIDPFIEVEDYDGIKIMKNIEMACRNCYRSEKNITDDSYKTLLKNCISRGHESILEHEKITIRMTVDIGVYKDLTRHRVGTAFSIESTRYCNYSKDKFEKEIKFIKPVNIEEGSAEFAFWKNCMEDIERYYLDMSMIDCTSDQLRMILPHSTAAQVVMTCNIREWRHILSLRCTKMTHPSIQQVLIPLLLKFKKDMPELFENIQYNEEFSVDKYAELKVLNRTNEVE